MGLGRNDLPDMITIGLSLCLRVDLLCGGASSIGESPALLVRVLYITGSSMKDLSLRIDHELLQGWGLSKNMSSLIFLRDGQSVKK